MNQEAGSRQTENLPATALYSPASRSVRNTSRFGPQSVALLQRLEVRRGSDPGPDVCSVVLVSFCDGPSAVAFHDI